MSSVTFGAGSAADAALASTVRQSTGSDNRILPPGYCFATRCARAIIPRRMIRSCRTALREAVKETPMSLVVHPLTRSRFGDLEAIFNAKGCSVARGCWCMFYRRSGGGAPLPNGVTRAQQNHSEMKALVEAGPPPGLIGYRGKTPVGWVTLGPREDFKKLARSPVMKPVDDRPVWS